MNKQKEAGVGAVGERDISQVKKDVVERQTECLGLDAAQIQLLILLVLPMYFIQN